ncbi:MAG: FAD-binding oxidoreductase [Candidatus Levybacteria bacterium CG10_big_fil_rev_8_21_14_0_10_35_13]|nr:MAG: FAD-binding oxidoreductase [Candidatus Levybacteria bacterium CG10_big_fil_rev_8_21_14_0_10_35_13]
MDNNLFEELKKSLKADVVQDEEVLKEYSHDASIYEVTPRVVIFPKNSEDIKNTVKFVIKHKKENSKLSVTARTAGTDMGGGSLNESIILSFTQHFNQIIGIKENVVTAEPGVYYRDFEKFTLKYGFIFPSFPASREICAIGGIVNNNSGGEKSFEYGKTEKYVKKLKMILSDGNEYEFEALNDKQLQDKLLMRDFEGEIYRNMYTLISKNYDLIKSAKPKVSKNSAGYFLWNVYDKEKKIFDLTKLFTGAQGTLGIMTQASIELIPVKKHSEMLVVFIEQKDMEKLGNIIKTVIPLKPESFETYDDHTLKLAVKFFHEFAQKLGAKNIVSTAFHFIPEFLMVLKGGLPKLILQIEFTGNNLDDLKDKIKLLKEGLKPFNLNMRVAGDEMQSKKYWLIRRESFNLLRQKIKDKHTAPFIDDFVINPLILGEFLPKLNKILAKHPSLIYTIAGHVGDGNFHIIPLMNLHDESQREIIPKLSEEVYDLVFSYKGSTTGEHNDGLVRSAYLRKMYGEEIYKLFEKTKEIFDPLNIFNPLKKTDSNAEFSYQHIRKNW